MSKNRFLLWRVTLEHSFQALELLIELGLVAEIPLIFEWSASADTAKSSDHLFAGVFIVVFHTQLSI